MTLVYSFIPTTLGISMDPPTRPNAMLKLERFLVEHNVVSGTFSQLASSKFDQKHNRKRLLTIAFQLAMAIRFMLPLIFKNVEVCKMFGDVFWTFGIMGISIRSTCLILTIMAILYLMAIAYCEYRGQLGFLNDLNLATKVKSDHTTVLLANTRLIYRALVVNLTVVTCLPTVVLLALCTLKAYRINRSVPQLIYDSFSSAIYVLWVKSMLMSIFSISALTYLSASLINRRLDMVYSYLQLSEDPFTTSRVLDEYTGVTVKVDKSNKLIRFVLGAVNMLSVPVISFFMTLISEPNVNILLELVVITALSVVVGLFIATAAFIASVNNKVKLQHIIINRSYYILSN